MRRGGGLPLGEWQRRSAQPLAVTAVPGVNVRRWSQQGDQVLVWLEPPIKGESKGGVAAPLQLTGWLPLSGADDAKRAHHGLEWRLHLRLVRRAREEFR